MSPRLLLSLALVATPALAAGDTKQTFSVDLKPGGMHEECVKLAKDESRHYEWASNSALDFNIHYHDGSEVFYPLKKDSVAKQKGTFKAKVAQDYCWMWTAKAPAKLEGSLAK
jgi:hypothetical protein